MKCVAPNFNRLSWGECPLEKSDMTFSPGYKLLCKLRFMPTYFQSFIHDRFYVIKENCEVVRLSSLEACQAERGKLWIVVDSFKEYYAAIPGYQWRIPNYVFYRNYPQLTNLSINGWRVEGIHISKITVNYLQFDFAIVDPLERVKDFGNICADKAIMYTDSSDHVVLIEILKKISEVCIYQSWEHFDLMVENQRLKKEIESLKEKWVDLERPKK